MIPYELKKSFLKQLCSSDEILVVHHWDTDGVASASIALDYLSQSGFKVYSTTPEIGLYDAESIRFRGYIDSILILDYALDYNSIRRLEEKLKAKALVVDHHYNKLPRTPRLLNSYTHELGVYPSTTTLLAELLDHPLDQLVALGILGDLGSRGLGYLGCFKLGCKPGFLLEASKLLDYPYKCMREDLVEKSVYKLLEYYYGDFKSLLRDELLLECKSVVEREEERVYGDLELEFKENVVVARFSSRYMVLSSIGRRLASKHRDKIVVLFFKLEGRGRFYVYARSWRFDLTRLIEKLRALGFNAGGKREVASGYTTRVVDEDRVISEVLREACSIAGA